MSDSNYGFAGIIPPGMSIQDNIQIAQVFQQKIGVRSFIVHFQKQTLVHAQRKT